MGSPFSDRKETTALELIQLAIDDCDNWEDWDREDRSNFENMGTNLERVKEEFKVSITALKNLYDILLTTGWADDAIAFAGEALNTNQDAIIQENVDANN